MNNPYGDLLTDEQYTQLIAAPHAKATASNGNAGCVAVASQDGFVSIQDDKLAADVRADRTQVFTHYEFACFVRGIKDGEFDHLI
ncbi:DUF397 domain-containing protein [Saccharopolyspora sp. NPDC002578]